MPQNALAVPTKDKATHASRKFCVTHHRRCDPCCAFPFSHCLGVGVGEKPVSLSAISLKNDTLNENRVGRWTEIYLQKKNVKVAKTYRNRRKYLNRKLHITNRQSRFTFIFCMFLSCAKHVCMHRRVRSLRRHLNPRHLSADFPLNTMETLPGRRKDVSALDRRQVWHDPVTQAGMCKKRNGVWIFFRNPEGVAQFWRIGEKLPEEMAERRRGNSLSSR